MMLMFSSQLKLGKITVHNTISNEFKNVVSTFLTQGFAYASPYTIPYVSQIPYLQGYVQNTPPNGVLLLFMFDDIVVAYDTPQVVANTNNSVALQVTDDSTNEYQFNRVELWTTLNGSLYYRVAYSNLQTVTKSSYTSLEVTWTISWTEDSQFVNLLQSILQKQPLGTLSNIFQSTCTQTVLDALIMGLLGLPSTVNACMYKALYNLIQDGIFGIGQVAFQDVNGNIITCNYANKCVLNLTTPVIYYVAFENIGGVLVPLFGGQVTAPIPLNTFVNVLFQINVT